MKYVVYGAGAVGGVIGGLLHQAGHPVTLVARGAHLAAMRSGGLRLDTGAGVAEVAAPATDTAARVSWSEDTVVVLAVKSHQAAEALADLRNHAPPDIAIVCATNGIATEQAALRLFGRVYALCVMLPSTHLDPGLVVAKCHPTPGILDIGHIPGGTDALTAVVSADLRSAGFVSEERPDILAWKRRKLVVNAVGDVGALFGRDDAGRHLAERVRVEAEAALAAAGFHVVTQAADDERRGDALKLRDTVASISGNSLRQSLSRGLDSEIDYRAGEIVLLGRLHGTPTPANEAIVAATRDLTSTGGDPRRLDARVVLDALDQQQRGAK
ncbi:2-dehydropantoate 2-reductase [Nocardioides sp.]|uniref:ketopantoate reductase family protein n=1 Tax=Nocardioides sp. TaxID=35761 RepID=UPI002C8DAE0D|nr:2-dehydropantoate 2-reductase [Nocardioides sp.]HXH76911.1 2-dehydropantoate 2-reductase [Nocardioides sp.]